jgi:hypothetical protein
MDLQIDVLLCRHLNQCRRTIDANFQSNHYKKNCNISDVSVFNGHAYFPTNETYKATVATSKKINKQVSGC